LQAILDPSEVLTPKTVVTSHVLRGAAAAKLRFEMKPIAPATSLSQRFSGERCSDQRVDSKNPLHADKELRGQYQG
jgi:hypothetical protein